MKRVSGSLGAKNAKKRSDEAEAELLRVALIEAHEALERAGIALRGHQGDYHYKSYDTSEMIEQVLLRIKAALDE